MKLPSRPKQHISETASFKLFSSKVPDNWIIREVTERDYGIDCYLELVDDDDSLTGDLVLIQLKSRAEIKWTKDFTYTISGIEISTSNYWYQFAVPVFIFIADVENQAIFMLSVHSYIRDNFREFIKQETFSYQIRQQLSFGDKQSLILFRYFYRFESHRKQFENEMLFFISNYENFISFQEEHSFRDYHLGIEMNDLVFFEAMHANYRFLTIYLNIINIIPSLKEIKVKSLEKFGNETHYILHEHDLSELSYPFQRTTTQILKSLRNLIIGEERQYWEIINPTLLEYIETLK